MKNAVIEKNNPEPKVEHTPGQCSDCNTNPALNDDSRGIKWIQGNVIKVEPCGCTIEGRGFCNYPIHIHYCDTHKAAPDMLAALKAIRDTRDYFAEHNKYPPNTIGKDQCFDDWAADLAAAAIRKASGGGQ